MAGREKTVYTNTGCLLQPLGDNSHSYKEALVSWRGEGFPCTVSTQCYSAFDTITEYAPYTFVVPTMR